MRWSELEHAQPRLASGDQFVATWPPGREFVRRHTSATSVGDPEPLTDLVR